MGQNKRHFERKQLDPINIQGLISIQDLLPIADSAFLVDASPSGFRLLVKRKDLISEELRDSLTLESLEGIEISLFIPAMELDVTGIIVRTRHIGEGVFEVGIDYTSDAPQYWRECLCELLPMPGEMAS